MAISDSEINICIDSVINRLGSEQATTSGKFIFNLRDYQDRITNKLVDDCIHKCSVRGLVAERDGDNLIVTVDLHTCVMTPLQAHTFNVALDYTRNMHGNHL